MHWFQVRHQEAVISCMIQSPIARNCCKAVSSWRRDDARGGRRVIAAGTVVTPGSALSRCSNSNRLASVSTLLANTEGTLAPGSAGAGVPPLAHPQVREGELSAEGGTKGRTSIKAANRTKSSVLLVRRRGIP